MKEYTYLFMFKASLSIFIACILILLTLPTPVKADLFYWPSEYHLLFSEKVALELELKQLNRQFTNERANLKSRISELEKSINDLNNKIALLEKSSDEEKKALQGRIKDLENVRDILKKKGTEREKQLVQENKNLQLKCREENERLRNELQKERELKIAELARQKQDYEKRISDLESRLANITGELSEFKKLSESQKRELERMSSQANELEKQLEEEIKKGQIRLKRVHEKIIINIDEKISFDTGKADLKKNVLNALDKISKILSNYPENTIMIEGHTDNVPIHNMWFRDNWQLSTERALAVLNYLLRNTNLNPSRLAAVGYGEYQPEVLNDSDENRALNRRVDIVVIPRLGK